MIICVVAPPFEEYGPLPALYDRPMPLPMISPISRVEKPPVVEVKESEDAEPEYEKKGMRNVLFKP